MALITDPDFLNQGTEVVIDTSARTIQLVIAGNLDTDGVTLKAVYSFLKEEWRNDPSLIRYDFPMTPITDEQMQIGVSSRNNGWNWADQTTRELIRTGGWQEVSNTGVVLSEYAGIISLGTLQVPTQVYYQQEFLGPTEDFVLEGVVNQAVKIFDSTGPVDQRDYFKLFAREQGDTYATSQLSEIGVALMTYQAYRFPLTTTTDIKVDATDNDIETLAPYTGMSITFYDSPQTRNIGGIDYDFGIIIDGNNGTAEQIYEFVQFQLRQLTNINDDVYNPVIGNIAPELLRFIGDTLETLFVDNPLTNSPDPNLGGVYIDNFQASDINRLVFRDNANTTVTFPFTATLTLNFSTTLQNDADAIYRVFFTNDNAADVPAGNNFGTDDAIIPRTNQFFTTTFRERDADEATITTALAHGLSEGDVVEIIGLGGTGYNGVFVVIDVPTTTTFTYNNVGGDESSVADTGGTVYRLMGGAVDGQASIQFGYDYDTNVQRGAGSEEKDAPITAVAIGLFNAQYVLATGNIARSNANVVVLTAPVERNYDNPV
jgi:hypothetical protein